MRIAALMTICILAAGQASSETNTIGTLETDLRRLNVHSFVRQEIIEAQNKFPRYHEQFQRADSVSRVVDMRIDFIGQWHLARTNSWYDEEQVRLSQARVSHLLDSLDYDLAGHEGWDYRPITCDTLKEVLCWLSDQTGRLPDPMRLRDALWSIREFDGVFDWMCRGDQHLVTGIEDRALIDLHGWYYHHDDATAIALMRLGPQAYADLGVAIRQARTELALALMILELDRRGLRRGAIVMGISHFDDFRSIAPRYRLRWQYWPSIDLSKGQAEKARTIRQQLKLDRD